MGRVFLVALAAVGLFMVLAWTLGELLRQRKK